jgi:hypothetical protein
MDVQMLKVLFASCKITICTFELLVLLHNDILFNAVKVDLTLLPLYNEIIYGLYIITAIKRN